MIRNVVPWSSYVYFVFLSLIAALGNMGVVYTINRIVKDFFTETPVATNTYLWYFFCSLVLFVVCRYIFSMGIIRLTQKQLRATRLNVLKMVLRSSYSNLVKNKSQVYTSLTRDTDNIVGASINLVDIMTNGIVIVICFVYMGTLSWKLLLCMVGLMSITLLIYAVSTKRAEKFFGLGLQQNDRFVRYLNEILNGFKEISMERRIGHEISRRHIDKAVSNLSVYNQKAHIGFLNNRIIGQLCFYLFIGFLLLGLGNWFQIDKSVLVNFIFLVLYIWGPIETVVLFIPAISQAKTSLKRIETLEKQINESDPVVEDDHIDPAFSSLTAADIGYQYVFDEGGTAKKGFDISNVNFHANRGDAIFICGGNGSGKTTFINILIGLLQPDTGSILVNGKPVPNTQSTGYKSLFAPLFSDFHLFDEFYGIEEVDYEKAQKYLALFEIDEKVSITEGRFSDIKVSTGQRKRLAFINAMLARKPVLVLDEFAADQDPAFKRKFYETIIPYVKAEGFTLVAITHDDNYYRYADKLFKMDSGKLYEITTVQQPVIDMVDQL